MKRAVLITGADGYLGLRLVKDFLERTDYDVLAFIRPKEKEFPVSHPRLTVLTGELREENPFRTLDVNKIELIFHSASVTRFNIEEDLAREVNYEGAVKVFRFAENCPHLKKMIYLSTVYAAGLRTGTIPEESLDASAGFANFYEQSKNRAENTLINEFPKLPWMIARIATIIADGDNGTVTQYNVVHNTLKLLYYGLISLLPGKNEVPLYFVTGDFITQALHDLAMKDVEMRRVYHLVHKRKETLTLGRLVDVVHEVFEKDPGFATRRVLKPLMVDEPTFKIMADQMNSFSGGVVQQALQSISPFAKQLFIDKDFQNDAAVAVVSGYRAPNPEDLVRKTAEQLVATKWGRK